MPADLDAIPAAARLRTMTWDDPEAAAAAIRGRPGI